MAQSNDLQRRLLQNALVAELGLLALGDRDPQELADYAVGIVAEALTAPMAGYFKVADGHVVLPNFDEIEAPEQKPASSVTIGDKAVGAGVLSVKGSHLILQSGHGWLNDAQGLALMDTSERHARETLRSGEPVTLLDDIPIRLAQYGVVDGISVRLGGAGEEAGILGAYSTRSHHFDEEARSFLGAVAAVLSGAREHARTAQALRESEARARAILNTTVDGVVTINERGIIESFNPAAERIFGYKSAEVVGHNVSILMPEPYHSEHDGYIDAYKKTGERRIIGIGREVVGKRKDGTTFPLDLAVSEVRLPERRIFTGILRDITERRELEQAVLSVAEDERRRIGQDLHDGLGQMLTGTGLIARGLARKLATEGLGFSDDADELVKLIKEADQYARSISRGLVPVELDTHGLDDALSRLAANSERLFDIACVLTTRGEVSLLEKELSPDVSPHLFRIAQEAVSNAAFHGKASTVEITLIHSPAWLTLRISDDGVGFPGLLRSAGATRLEPVPGKRDKDTENRGMGVRIMHYRARIIGGALEIRLGPNGGTVVTCSVPLGKDRPASTS